MNLRGTADAGRTVAFTATFGGTQPMTNQWKVDKGSSFTSIANATNTTLTLNNVATNGTGTYALFASNAAGSSNSTPIIFTVLSALPEASWVPSGRTGML